MSLLERVDSLINGKYNQLGAVVAVAASSLSLILSVAYNLAPCTLCYWQRIFMYPLAIIYVGAMLRKDKMTFIYSLPLSVLGAGFAGYHYLLQRGWIELAESCISGVSCTDQYIEYFGFFTIPFGAFLGFLALTVIGVLQARQTKFTANVAEFTKQLQPVVLAVLAIILVTLAALEITL